MRCKELSGTKVYRDARGLRPIVTSAIDVVYYNDRSTIAGARASCHPKLPCQLGPLMPSQPKNRPVKARARAPVGKRQVLVIMDQEVIKSVKVAAVEDDIKMSHAVERAVRDWLSRRKRARAMSKAV